MIRGVASRLHGRSKAGRETTRAAQWADMRTRVASRPASIALVLAGLALMLTGVTPALAAPSRIDSRSTSTFTLDPDKRRVNVTVDIVVTNQIPPSVRSGPCPSDPSRTCRITTDFFTQNWGFLAVQHGARKLKVRGPGGSIKVDYKNATYTNYSLGFNRIQRGQSARLKVTYHLPAARGGCGNNTRISPATRRVSVWPSRTRRWRPPRPGIE